MLILSIPQKGVLYSLKHINYRGDDVKAEAGDGSGLLEHRYIRRLDLLTRSEHRLAIARRDTVVEVLLVKLCALVAEDRRREEEAERHDEDKEIRASGGPVEYIHIGLTEKTEDVVEQVSDHCAYQRAASVKHERKRTRNRGCTHNESMRIIALSRESTALLDTESVLFIGDNKT